MSVEVRFPPPTPPMSQNALDKLHWSKRRKIVAVWQMATLNAWRSLPQETRNELRGVRVKATLEIPVTTNRRRDAHGWVALFKLLWDGLRCPEPRKGIPSCRATWPSNCGHPWPDDDDRYLAGVPDITFVKGGTEVVLRIWPA